MTKEAILITIDGSNSPVKEAIQELMEYLAKAPSKYGGNGTSMRIARYEFDQPDEVTYHIGKMMRFVAGNPKHGVPTDDPEPQGFRAWLRSELVPMVRQASKEIWYSKKQLEEMRQEELRKLGVAQPQSQT